MWGADVDTGSRGRRGEEGRRGETGEGKKRKERIAQRGLSHLPSFRIWCVKPRGLRPTPHSLSVSLSTLLGESAREKKIRSPLPIWTLNHPRRKITTSLGLLAQWQAAIEVFHPLFFYFPLPLSIPRAPSCVLVSHGTAHVRGGFL